MSRGTRERTGIHSNRGRAGMYSPNGTGCCLRYSPTISPSGEKNTLAFTQCVSLTGRSPPTTIHAPIRAASAAIASPTSGLLIGSAFQDPVEPSDHTTRSTDPGSIVRVSAGGFWWVPERSFPQGTKDHGDSHHTVGGERGQERPGDEDSDDGGHRDGRHPPAPRRQPGGGRHQHRGEPGGPDPAGDPPGGRHR